MDHAVSSDPAVQAQLDRLAALSPGTDVLGLERITVLLDRLGNPHHRLPPVFHVAGTNGKGSTCAFLRAAIEAAGKTVHVYTSPHLIRFNERIRVAGALIADDALAVLLAEVLDIADGVSPSFFEVTTAAAFLGFARITADACVIEVGLGGRLDATNVIAAPLICGIAQLGLDHQAFLGDTIEGIAAEKGGIAKPQVPLVTLAYPASQASRIGQVARAADAPWLARGGAWEISAGQRALHYSDKAGALELPLPRLPGAHQAINAGLAVAMLRHQAALDIPAAALRAAMGWADWPARLQRVDTGPLAALVGDGGELWLDGGHNPAAARAIADFFGARISAERPFHMILGMLANKDVAGFLAPFAGSGAIVHAVPVPGHACHDGAAVVAAAGGAGLASTIAADVRSALAAIGSGGATILIGGSLYLAGRVLEESGLAPA